MRNATVPCELHKVHALLVFPSEGENGAAEDRLLPRIDRRFALLGGLFLELIVDVHVANDWRERANSYVVGCVASKRHHGQTVLCGVELLVLREVKPEGRECLHAVFVASANGELPLDLYGELTPFAIAAGSSNQEVVSMPPLVPCLK